MKKIINSITKLSYLGFIFALLMVYAYLPKIVDVFSVELGIEELNKEDFFYFFFIFFILINVLFGYFFKVYILFNKDVPLAHWIRISAVVINLCLILLISYIGVMNNNLEGSAESYLYLLYIGIILFFIWIIGYIYFKTQEVVQK